MGLELEETVDELKEAEEEVPQLLSTARNGLRLNYEGALRREVSRSGLAGKSGMAGSPEVTKRGKTASPEVGKSSKTALFEVSKSRKTASPEVSKPSKATSPEASKRPNSGKSDKKPHERGSIDNIKNGILASTPAFATSISSSKNVDKNPDLMLESSPAASSDSSPPRRWLWDWARVEVSVPTLDIMGRRSYGDLRAVGDGKGGPTSHPRAEDAQVESRDDFSVPLAMSTDGTDAASQLEPTSDIVVIKVESLGLANSTLHLPPSSPLVEFAETKSSSDDIVAETNGHWADSPTVTPLKEPPSFIELQAGNTAGSSKYPVQKRGDVESEEEFKSSRKDEQQKDATLFWTEDAKGITGAILAKAGGLGKSRWSS
jgi:hypothetical protein